MVEGRWLKIAPTVFARPTVERTAEVAAGAIRRVACNPFRGACVWRPALPAGPSWTSARAPRRQAGLQVVSGPTRACARPWTAYTGIPDGILEILLDRVGRLRDARLTVRLGRVP